MPKDFKKYFYIPAPPDEVYMALTNAFTISIWTGEAAIMSADPGSEFSLWDGSIVGKNLAFEQNKMLQQEWYFGEEEEASIVTIKLHADPKGTSAELRHTCIPDEAYDDICAGWRESYFGSLIAFFEDD